MAKSRRRREPKGEVVAPPAVPLIPMGRSEVLKVKRVSAEEIVYTLSDRTRLHLRPVLISVERSLEKFNQTGDPLYQVSVGFILNPVVPKRLKRKGL